jgi:colanic acid/amylovoran biosynthesis glycosyltransferase
MKIAYITSRFPDRYHTFVRREINALAELGAKITIFPLVDNRRPALTELEADCGVSASIAYTPWLSFSQARAASSFSRPTPLAALLGAIFRDTCIRPTILAKSLAVVPKSLEIATRLRDEGFDHIHAHWATHPTTVALIAARLTGIPFSFAFHAYDLFETRILIPEKLRRAAFTVLNCRYTEEFLLRLYPETDRSKLLLLYNGMDWSEFPATANPPLNSPPLLMAVGNMIPTKGFTDFIRACRLLTDDAVRFSAVIIGSGPQCDELKALVRAEKLESVVDFPGELSQAGIRARLGTATALVMPCVTPRSGSHDALPNVVIEAQAAGVPVVATAVFGIPEIVHHETTGLLVPERDPQALKTALALLIRNPDHGRALALRARKQLPERFDIRTNARLLLSRFQAAASQKGGRP